MNMRLWIAPLLVVSVVGCDNEPGKDKPRAEVSAPVKIASTAPATTTPPAASPAVSAPPPAASAAPAAAGVAMAFSGEGSKLTFVGAKVTGKHEGGFKAFTGTLRVVDNNAEKSSVTVEIDMASVFSDQAKLTEHLKSDDFFAVAKFPKAKFVSTGIKVGGAAGATHTVTGNLDLHGVQKSISFPAKIKLTADSAEVEADFVINRKDFKIEYAGKKDDLIKDDVNLKLSIKAKK